MSRIHLLPLIALAVTVPALAQDTTAVRLDTVVVSAGKGPPGSATATQAVTVITGAELRAAGVQRVADALRLVPGAGVVGSGAVGSVTSLFIRGGESRYAKVLIDGVAVNAVGGYFDFSHLTTDNIERIEIVRGPSSVVHGADAMTGVVHVFTRRGGGAPAAELEARAGSYGTREIGGAVSGAGAADRLRYSLAGAGHGTDGILPFNNEYRNRTVSGSLRWSASAATLLDISTRYGTARYHYPTDFVGNVEDSNAFRDQRRLTAALELAHRITPVLELRVIAGAAGLTDIADDVDPPPPWVGGSEDIHSRFRTRTNRRAAEVRASYRLPFPGIVTSGVEYVRETERSTSTEGPVGSPLLLVGSFAGNRTTRVAFAEFAGDVQGLEYALSGRVDRPSDFGTFDTYRVGVASPRLRGVRLRAGAGTAFNAPAFSQLLPTDWTVASPDLSPERARSVEAGFDWAAAGERLRIGATRFEQRFIDLIQFVSGGPPDFLGSYANLARARSNGWELDVRAVPLSGWGLSGSYTRLTARVDRLDARYEGPLEPGQPLVRRPSRSAAAALSYLGWQRGSIALAARRVGSRPDLDFREFPAPIVRLPAHTVADVAATMRVIGAADGASGSLTLRVENLFDRRYQEILYYDAPGRTILLGGRIGWPLR